PTAVINRTGPMTSVIIPSIAPPSAAGRPGLAGSYVRPRDPGAVPEAEEPEDPQPRRPAQAAPELPPGDAVGDRTAGHDLHRQVGRKVLDDRPVGRGVADGVLEEGIDQAQHDDEEEPFQV